MRWALGECGVTGSRPPVAGDGDAHERERARAGDHGYDHSPTHASWHRIAGGATDASGAAVRSCGAPTRSSSTGSLQNEGTDFEVIGSSLLFERSFARERKLSFWRWSLLFLGVWSSYRHHDTIDVVHTLEGRRVVTSLKLPELTSEST